MNFVTGRNVLSFVALATGAAASFLLSFDQRRDRSPPTDSQGRRVTVIEKTLKGDDFAPSIFSYSFTQGRSSDSSESFAALSQIGGGHLPEGIEREFCLGALSFGATMAKLHALGLDRAVREAALRLETPIVDARERFAIIFRDQAAAAEFAAFGNFVVHMDGFTLPKELPHEIKVSYYRNLKQLAPVDFKAVFEKLLAKGDGKAAEMAMFAGGLQSVLTRLADPNRDNADAKSDSFLARCVDEIWRLDTQAIPQTIAGMEKLNIGRNTRLALIRAMLVSGNDFTPLLANEAKSKWNATLNEARGGANIAAIVSSGLYEVSAETYAKVALQLPDVFPNYADPFNSLLFRDFGAAARCVQSASPEVKAKLAERALKSYSSPNSLAEVENVASLFPPETRSPIRAKLLKQLAFDNYVTARVGLEQGVFSEAEKDDVKFAMAESYGVIPQADREAIISEFIQKGTVPEKGIQMACKQRFERDPASAAEYAQSLPGGKPQLSALMSVAKLWSESDPASASDWIATLPAGVKRDSAVSALVAASVYDKERAYGNLNAINDRATRIETGKRLIQQMVLISPSTVKADLAESGLPTADQTEILSEIAAPLLATP